MALKTGEWWMVYCDKKFARGFGKTKDYAWFMAYSHSGVMNTPPEEFRKIRESIGWTYRRVVITLDGVEVVG